MIIKVYHDKDKDKIFYLFHFLVYKDAISSYRTCQKSFTQKHIQQLKNAKKTQAKKLKVHRENETKNK